MIGAEIILRKFCCTPTLPWDGSIPRLDLTREKRCLKRGNRWVSVSGQSFALVLLSRPLSSRVPRHGLGPAPPSARLPRARPPPTMKAHSILSAGADAGQNAVLPQATVPAVIGFTFGCAAAFRRSSRASLMLVPCCKSSGELR